ncbi:unnamed protein product [Durusdinium trenchii]|uniref:Transmembrane protein n=1 Tax=Durusdinium trenchii TaxID=1381693 RepID=A0ABP0J8V9_9DINO
MALQVMANKAPLVKVQAEKRSSETGGGQLPKELPFQFREAMNQALKREKLTRQRLRSTRGHSADVDNATARQCCGRIPTLLGITSLVSSCVAMVLLHVLQIDAALGVGLLAVPPALALFGWTVMWILLMKHWRKHQRLLQDIMGCLRTCCEELSREHRALAVNLVTRTEEGQRSLETAAMDWLGRDVFCVDFRIINEDFGNELRSLPKQRALDAEESTRPPSGKSEGSSLPAEQRGGAELRTLATLAPDEQLQLRPVSERRGAGGAMGKKRRRDEEDEAEGGSLGGLGVVHVQDLRDEELQEREAELAETLRKARLNQGNLRGDPPKTNRILWQRQVTYANNAVHRAEQAYREVRQEIERRTYGASLGISPIRRFRK